MALVYPAFDASGHLLSPVIDNVEVVYIGYFGRGGDPAGTTYWATQLIAGGDTTPALTGIAASFSVQPEAKAEYAFLASPLTAITTGTNNQLDQFINQVYQNLFGHAADGTDTTGGLAFWRAEILAALAASDPTVLANQLGSFILQIAFGAQAADQAVLEAKVTVADFLTTTFQAENILFGNDGSAADMFAHTEIASITPTNDSAAAIAAAEAAITAFLQPGQTFTLTPGVDTLPGTLIGNLGTHDTSGNDTIIGTNIGLAATWTMNPSDQINAGAGINTFKLFSDGTAGATALAQFPTLTNVQNLFVNDLGAYIVGAPFDVTGSKFPNLTGLQLDDIGGGAAVVVTYVKLAHQSLTISGDSAYGGNPIGMLSAVDTSENVIFNGAGKSTAHDIIGVFGTNAAGSADTGLTISSIGAANFADYGGFGFNSLSSITFATNTAGDTAFTGNQFSTSALAETIDASAFTASLTLGTAGAALAVSIGWGDGASGFGDTVKLGSGTTYFAEHKVSDGFVGDNITLLAAHTKIDTLDSTATTAYLQATAYSTLVNENQAMTTVTHFNLGNGAALSGDILKMGVGTEAVGSATDIGTVNGHLYANVGTGTGFVTSAGVTSAAAFLADVYADANAVAVGDVIAWVDTVNHNTYIAEFNVAVTANHVEIVELVGVSTPTATALSLAGGVAGTIHIA